MYQSQLTLANKPGTECKTVTSSRYYTAPSFLNWQSHHNSLPNEEKISCTWNNQTESSASVRYYSKMYLIVSSKYLFCRASHEEFSLISSVC